MGPKKRGQPPKVRAPEPEDTNPTDARPAKRRRAGGPEEAENAEAQAESSKDSRQPAKGKGKSGPKPSARDEEQDRVPENTSARRSRRERRSADDNPWWTANQTSPDTTGGSKEAIGSQKKRKRGDTAASKPSAQPGPSQPKPAKKRKPGRTSLAEVSVSRAQNQASPPHREPEQPKKQASRPRRSLSPAPAAAPSPKPSTAAPPYRHLTPHTRSIPRATIASKWRPLSAPSLPAISALLADASRPVLHRLRAHPTRHAHAQAVLRIFSAGLTARLRKGMPFPPPSVPAPAKGKNGEKGGGHAVELDFERVVDAAGQLERVLEPLGHAVMLLRQEKEREERELRREYEVLRRLEGDAKAQVRGWRGERGRGREHVLVPEGGGGGGEGGLEVVARGKGEEGVFESLQDEDEMLALSQQIGNHMESMRSNLGQIEGVLPAIAKSRAALQATLCEHLDPEQYEQALLG